MILTLYYSYEEDGRVQRTHRRDARFGRWNRQVSFLISDYCFTEGSNSQKHCTRRCQIGHYLWSWTSNHPGSQFSSISHERASIIPSLIIFLVLLTSNGRWKISSCCHITASLRAKRIRSYSRSWREAWWWNNCWPYQRLSCTRSALVFSSLTNKSNRL